MLWIGVIGLSKKIRVYDRKGDFIIEVPDAATCTFGYFNPNAGQSPDRYGNPQNVAKQTALRVYEKGAKSRQIGCFLDVLGFRYEDDISLTRLTEEIKLTRTFEDNGEGSIRGGFEQDIQMKAIREAGTYS